MKKNVRHILSLSGGKDSTALAIYMRDRVPDMEYVFMDTGEELPETYAYLDRLEVYLGASITRLQNQRQAFRDLLAVRRGFLPSAQARWCTQYLKLKPFEEYVSDDEVLSYIAIRYDERDRKGFISSIDSLQSVYPFVQDGICKQEVFDILDRSGIGVPDYYRWRSRSGCYFCFFQQRIEWVGLLENHPDLFWSAAKLEKSDSSTGEEYTWSGRESLRQLSSPERIRQIKDEHAARIAASGKDSKSARLMDIVGDLEKEDGCVICHL